MKNGNKDKSLIKSTNFGKDYLMPLVLGKIPPQSLDLEGAVIGSILIDMNALYECKPIITTHEMFYSDANQRIYSAILYLDSIQSPIDFILVCEELRKRNELEMVGGSHYVVSLTRDVTSSLHITEHARIIAQKYLSRELIRISGEIISTCYEDSTDIFDVYDSFEINMKTAMYQIIAGTTKSYEGRIREFVKNINDPNFRESYYVPTGLPSLDEKLGGGFLRGSTTLIAARTSMGKTSFVISLANEQSKKFPVGIWNGELTARRFIMRQISNKEKITISDMNKKDIEQNILDRINMGAQELMSDHKIFMDETTPIYIQELISMIRYWVVACGCKVVYLDYLRYIMLPSEYRYDKMSPQQKIEEIMSRLNALAKELNIPIVLIQQLNRETEKNADKKPTLANLRDAGALEEMSACVLFLYRPEHYGVKELEDFQGSTKDLGMVLIRKNGDHTNPVDVFFRTDAKYFTWRELESDFNEEIIQMTGVTINNIKDQIDDLPF